MNIKKLIMITSCFLLASCSLMQGGGKVDSLMDAGLPIRINLDQEGYGAKRLPKKARWYRVYWGAVTVGDIYVVLIPTKEGYGMRSEIRSRGIAKMVSGWRSDTGVTMRFEEPDKYIPVKFKTAFRLRDRERKIEIVRDKNGDISAESNVPPENRNKRPAVPDKDKVGVYDPMTAIMAGRMEVRKAILDGKREFVVPVYDGRRRSDMLFKIHGADKNGNIHVSFKEGAVAGYTNNELENLKDRDPEFHILISSQDLLPIAAKGESLIGTAYIKLIKECATLQECVTASEEEG